MGGVQAVPAREYGRLTETAVRRGVAPGMHGAKEPFVYTNGYAHTTAFSLWRLFNSTLACIAGRLRFAPKAS